MLISVIVPTFNRPGELHRTLQGLYHQTLSPADYEVVVVDDGSSPPATLPPSPDRLRARLVRFDSIIERCVARNAGASVAAGQYFLFLDDDLEVGSSFLQEHLDAHREWSRAVVCGPSLLPAVPDAGPFVQYRMACEASWCPPHRGLCETIGAGAGNMSISRSDFLLLEGFDERMVGIEDVDIAFRFAQLGGRFVFVPRASAVHWDHVLDIVSYCRRTAWAAECAVKFIRLYPSWPMNQERDRANGPIRFGRESLRRSLSKAVRWLLGLHPFLDVLYGCTWLLERLLPGSRPLHSLYSLLVGVAWLRGYRRGLRQPGLAVAPPPGALPTTLGKLKV